MTDQDALVQAMIRMGLLDEQDAAMGDDLKDVRRYAEPQGNPYAGAPNAAAPVGALMYGLADVLRSGVGAYKERGIREKREANSLERGKSRDMYAQALIDALRGGGAGSALAPGGTPASAGAIPGMGAGVPDMEQQIQALFMPAGRRTMMPRFGGSGG